MCKSSVWAVSSLIGLKTLSWFLGPNLFCNFNCSFIFFSTLSLIHPFFLLLRYSNHDSTLRVILSALKIFDEVWPPYASHIAMELWENAEGLEKKSVFCFLFKLEKGDILWSFNMTEEWKRLKAVATSFVRMQNLLLCSSHFPTPNVQRKLMVEWQTQISKNKTWFEWENGGCWIPCGNSMRRMVLWAVSSTFKNQLTNKQTNKQKWSCTCFSFLLCVYLLLGKSGNGECSSVDLLIVILPKTKLKQGKKAYHFLPWENLCSSSWGPSWQISLASSAKNRPFRTKQSQFVHWDTLGSS